MVSNFQCKEYFKYHIDRYLKQIFIICFSSSQPLWILFYVKMRYQWKKKPHSHFAIKNSSIPSPCKKSWIVLVSIRLRLKNINSICVWFIRKVLNPLTPRSCFSKWNKSSLCCPRAGRHWREVGKRSGTRYYECQTPPWLAFLNAAILHASKETLAL